MWTKERVETALGMWRNGVPAKVIAARLGVSRNAVIGKMNRMGVRHGDKGGVHFDDAAPGQCRFPLWSAAEKTGNICGKGAVPGMSWCQTHLSVVSADRRHSNSNTYHFRVKRG